mgnify:CR=1 FL=1
MKVTEKVVKNIAELAKLELNQEEMKQLMAGMQTILNLAAQMESIDTKGIEPVYSPLDSTQELRYDEVTEKNQRDLYQSIAPDTEDGLYLVPRVVE